MENAGRNPDWTRDEIMLALEFYLTHKDKIPGKTSQEIGRLSEEIRQTASLFGLSGDDKFRNTNGVYMKIMNLRSHDPAYTSQGKVGLPSVNKLEQEVWDRFGHDLESLRLANTLIRDALAGVSVVSWPYEDAEPEVEEAAEGRLVTRLHRTRERSKKLVDRKKRSFLKKHGRLFCGACGFDFEKTYGDRGKGFIECHHTKPVHEMKPNETTKLEDLVLLCANCHRMVHSQRPWLTIDELQSILR